MQTSSKIHLPSVFQLLFSGLGLAVFLTSAISVLALGILSLLGNSLFGQETLPLLSLAWTAGISGVLLIPSTAYALMRLLHRPLPNWKLSNPLRTTNRAMLLWSVLVGLGMLISGSENLALWVLPPIQILILGLPLWWLVERGRAGLETGSPQRSWGILGFGLTITSTFTLIAEILAIVILGLLGTLWISTQPEWMEEITRIGQRLAYAQMDPVIIERIITPFLRQPGVLFGILAFTSGIVPLLEELIKPLALWGFAGRKLTPAEGFVMGAMCGATFALFESLGMFLSAGSGEGWAILILGRTGTGILHTVTAAVMGWGLVSAWSERKYWSLGGSYLIAVSLHSLWNLFAMLSGFGILLIPEEPAASLPLAARLGMIAPVVLPVLALTLLAIFFGFNRRLRANAPTAAIPAAE